ncbi:MAG: hypothetical protein QF707_00320 [Candidatus Poseidoniaceae archaeon]|jgi:hypothetical protein|nr:hypothetical protein [Candidatus Poseidoniaceae archaeon]
MANSSADSSNENIIKKWVMRQYWRVQQSQAFISIGFWATTLTLLIWPYVRWRFKAEETTLGLANTYWGLSSIFIGVMVLVLFIGWIYDRVLGLWIEWRSVDTERNPFMTYALSPTWMMSMAMQAEILKRVASDDENVVAHAEWVHEWCRTQSSEEIFARTVQKWDEFMPTPTPDFWFLEKGTVEDARKIKFDNDN